MSDIRRRIKTIEKQLHLGARRKSALAPPIVILHFARSGSCEDYKALGPVETWITYQEQAQAAQEADAERLRNNPHGLPGTIVFEQDVGKELEARRQLKATKSDQISKSKAEE